MNTGNISVKASVSGNTPGLKGEKGNGIKSTVLNDDYTLTLNYTNGTSDTTPPIRGQKGEKGDNGISPSITTSKSGKVTTITIKDATGTKKATINDGVGDMLKSTYDKNSNGIVDNSEKVNGHTVESNVPANAKFTDTIYTHPITSGNKHIPSGGSSGQILKWEEDGTAKWGDSIEAHREGKELKVNNYKQLIKFSREGKTEQKNYTGKNIFDYFTKFLSSVNGVTSVINDDGSITTIGKPTKAYTSIISAKNITDLLEDGQTYTLSQEYATDKLYIQVTATASDGTNKYIHVGFNDNNKISFVIDKSTYKSYSISVLVGTLNAWGDSSLTITNKYMICKGTDTADSSFEPYVGGTQSPSPDFPQEIENIKGIENLIDESLLIDTCTINGITLKKNDNNTFDLSGTVVDKDYNKQILILSKKIQSNKDYYFYCSQPYDGVNFNICLRVYYTDETQQNIIPNKVARIANKTIRTVAVVFWAKVGTTITNANNVKIMLSEKVNNYVPYGSNYLQLENVGENILNIDETPFTVKKITSQGNVLYWSGYSGVNDFVKVKEKTTYKFSSNEVNKVCYIDYYDKNKNYLSRTGTAVDYFTTPEKCKYIKFAINLELIPTNAQLMEGTIIKPYEPYQKKIISIDLKGNNLCSNKEQTLKDELVIENGRAKIIKKYDEVVLDGTENWTEYGNYQSGYLYYVENITKGLINEKNKFGVGLSSHFIWGDNHYPQIRFQNNNGKRLYIGLTEYKSLTEFKAWLKSLYDAGTPVKVQYQLAEPKVIDLGEVDFDLIENSTLTCEEESDMQIDYLTISSNIFVQDSLDGSSNQKAPSINAVNEIISKLEARIIALENKNV